MRYESSVANSSGSWAYLPDHYVIWDSSGFCARKLCLFFWYPRGCYCAGSGRGRRNSAMWPHQTTAELCTLLQSGLLKDELPADQPRHQECLVDHEKNDGFKYLGWLIS